ncbi:hypothetical protein CTZ27_31975 [Streptomyces griseocarneus]|nr:hypothetical protein CTZ27_31975 [Streptomyces griseocarneus]
MPFPSRIHPGATGARERNLAWVRRMGLVCGEEAQGRYLRSQVAELAARAFPDADDEGIDLGFALMGWFFLFDDQFDTPAGQFPDAAVSACRSLDDVVHTATDPVDGPPIVRSFADLWARMSLGMSPWWLRRTACEWSACLTATVTEAGNRRTGVRPDVDSYLRLRRDGIGVLPCLALSERVGGYEVPASVWHTSVFQKMRVLVCDHVIYVNDACSLEKDEARDEVNLARLLMDHHGWSRPAALAAMRRRADSCMETFLTTERELTSICTRLGLGTGESHRVAAYTDALRTWLRGAHDWHHSAGRYSPDLTTSMSADEPGYLNVEDLSGDSRHRPHGSGHDALLPPCVRQGRQLGASTGG